MGEKVRKLIEEHVYSTGVDPKIAPVDLLDEEYKEKLSSHKTDKAKAADIEHAIRNHIRINEADDPEYYRTLSQRLEDIIKEHEERWDQLSLFLIEFRDTIETKRRESARAWIIRNRICVPWDPDRRTHKTTKAKTASMKQPLRKSNPLFVSLLR